VLQVTEAKLGVPKQKLFPIIFFFSKVEGGWGPEQKNCFIINQSIIDTVMVEIRKEIQN
jgi:hypothetical protein